MTGCKVITWPVRIRNRKKIAREKHMRPVIDHIQITVKDMRVALPFYDKLMPLLGFNLENRTNVVVQAHEFHVVEYVHPQLAFGINSPREPFAQETVHRRKPGALHHLAFKVESKDEVRSEEHT